MVKTKHHIFFSSAVATAITTAVLIYSGTIAVVNKDSFYSLLHPNTITSIEATVISNPAKTSTGNYYTVTTDTSSVYSSFASSEARGHVRILVPTEIVEALYPGKLYSSVYSSINSKTLIIENGFKARFYGSFSINAKSQKSEYEAPLFIAHGLQEFGWKNSITKLRANFRLEFKRLLYAWGDAGGLLLALLSGSREYTNARLADAFKNAGLSHILALSGMHLSLFAGIALNLGSFAGKKLGSMLSLFAVIAFVWFAGLSASLLRALICTLISLVLQYSALPGVSGSLEVVYRFVSPSFTSIRLIRILSLSFIIHICFFPMDAFSAGFMLSYGALVGIALSELSIKPLLVRFLPECCASPLAASMGAQLCTAPITISLFGMIMPIGIISSVIVSPLALGFLVIGLCCIVLCLLFPFLLYVLDDIIHLLYKLLEHTVLWFAQFSPIVF